MSGDERPSEPDQFSTGSHATGDHDSSPELIAQVGRYRVQRVLGQGSFGRVFCGYDAELDRLVAIKVPHAGRVHRPEDIQLYLDEARALARLDHPGIVPVYDVGRTPEGHCYIVSKLIDGTDLRTRLKESRPSVREAVLWTASIADALQYAHRMDLVHRDVKPANILVDKGGNAYLTDFGVALREQDLGTRPGIAGTPAYMSPEQAQGNADLLDGRSVSLAWGPFFTSF